jgi:hypothetical protein
MTRRSVDPARAATTPAVAGRVPARVRGVTA